MDLLASHLHVYVRSMSMTREKKDSDEHACYDVRSTPTMIAPGHIQSPSDGQSTHVTTLSAAFLPAAYVPLGHSNVHGMLPAPENKPVALSAECPRHALPAGHGSHAATVVAELIGPVGDAMVPAGQDMVH